jgi:TorA maturation chaperone TorD
MNQQLTELPMLPVINLNQFRESVYLFLSRSFSREVDPVFFDQASKLSDSFEEIFTNFNETDLITGVHLLKGFFQEAHQKGKETVLQDLAEYYAFLFLSVGRENVSLCESAYRSEGGLLFQDSYFDIVKRYNDMDLMKRQDFPEPEDHLSVEMAYMARLCRLTITSILAKKNGDIKRYYNSQKDFLHDHLIPWVPTLSDSLLKADPSPFYTAVARLLNGFIHLEEELIDLLLSEVVTREDSRKKRSNQGKERR